MDRMINQTSFTQAQHSINAMKHWFFCLKFIKKNTCTPLENKNWIIIPTLFVSKNHRISDIAKLLWFTKCKLVIGYFGWKEFGTTYHFVITDVLFLRKGKRTKMLFSLKLNLNTKITFQWVLGLVVSRRPDPEKVINCPQAENSEF